MSNLHDGVDAPTVALPHAPEARLSADVPDLTAQEENVPSPCQQSRVHQQAEYRTYLYRHVAFGDLPHVEPHGGNHVFTELTRLPETIVHGRMMDEESREITR